MPDFSLENQLLTSLAGIEPTRENICLARQIVAKPLDWDYLLQTGLRNGIAPLLYHHLSRLDYQIPAKVNTQLARTSHMAGFYNLHYLDELNRLLGQLESAGIKPALLKGITLTGKLPRNIALRAMQDVDLLIKREDFPRVDRILMQSGFIPDETYCSKTGFMTCLKSITYTKPGLGLTIDVQWHFLLPHNPFSIDIQEIWARCQRIKIENIEALTLSTEDMILFLCLHALFNHCGTIGLKAFGDLGEIIRCNQLDISWPDLANQAIRYQLAFILYAGLYLTRKIVPNAIPLEIFNQLEPHCARTQLKWLERSQSKLLIATRSSSIETLVRLKMITGIKGKIKLLCQIFFPPLNELALYHSFQTDNRLAYLYYLLVNLKKSLIKLISKVSIKIFNQTINQNITMYSLIKGESQ